jgi:hypothetical protein
MGIDAAVGLRAGRVGATCAVLLAFLVSSCGESASDRAERADANARNALFRAEQLASRVSQLEARIAAMEERLRM